MVKDTVKPFDFGGADFGKIADEPQEMELIAPAGLSIPKGSPLGVFLMVRGYQSDSFKSVALKEGNELRRRNFVLQRKGKADEIVTLEEDQQAGLRLTSHLLVGWRTVIDGKSEPVVYVAGEAWDFTPENVRRWLSTYDWVVPQINEFAEDIQNFTKG